MRKKALQKSGWEAAGREEAQPFFASAGDYDRRNGLI